MSQFRFHRISSYILSFWGIHFIRLLININMVVYSICALASLAYIPRLFVLDKVKSVTPFVCSIFIKQHFSNVVVSEICDTEEIYSYVYFTIFIICSARIKHRKCITVCFIINTLPCLHNMKII